jgi:hypothetical protein
MTSLRYIILSLIYILEYYFVIHRNSDDDNSIYRNQYLVLFISTFIFIYIIKYQENSKCTVNKLDNKYLLSQSVFYSLIALMSHNIYKFLIEKECIGPINNTINDISKITYVLEALFVAGIVLFTNQLSYLIYPKCS